MDPEQMAPGDILCILGGANMPFLIRKNDGHYNLVGPCFVDGVMEGEAVQCMKAGTTHRGPFDPKNLLSKLYDFEAFSPAAREIMEEMEQEILDMTSKEYAVLKEEFIELG